MTNKTQSVSLGRARLPVGLAHELKKLKPGLRGRTVALILIANAKGINLPKLVESNEQIRRLGILINQSLRLSLGMNIDQHALLDAVKIIKSLHV